MPTGQPWPAAPAERITSVDNPQIKAIRALHDRRGRRRQGAFLVEGVRLVGEALRTGQQPLVVLIDEQRLGPRRLAELRPLLAPLGPRLLAAGPAALRAACDTETPQGLVAVLPLPPNRPLPAPATGQLWVIADRLQDPGNLGSLLRSTLGAGGAGLLTTPGSVDPFSPKVVRAAMGAHFRLTIAADQPWAQLLTWLDRRLPLLGSSGQASQPYDSIAWPAGAVLVVGNEAGGLGPTAQAAIDGLIGIPLAAGLESLNAAVAAAIILFEAARQRRRAAAGTGPAQAL